VVTGDDERSQFLGLTSVYTGDAQAFIAFASDVMPVRTGGEPIRISITPLDPATVGPPPPGLRYDGNAYTIEAVYAGSGARAVPRKPVTVILRYATGATHLLRRSGSVWVPVEATDFRAALQLAGETEMLGIFATAAPENLPLGGRIPRWAGLSILAVLLAMIGVLLWVVAVREPRRRRGPATGRRNELRT
jgi:hypothetical protein